MASFLETGMEIARDAGALLRTYFERRVSFELKGESDLVTEADRASEKLIVERLRSHFPTHAIVAEEGGNHAGNSGYRWYVDPLDGTTNFAHSYPVFNVTLGLERDGEMIAGVIYDPVRDEMFSAERGAGAYLNYRPIRVSQTRHLAAALLVTGFPSVKRHDNINIHFYYQLAMASHGVRRSGSAALDLAYVAAGRFDAFWEFGLKPWDMAAGILIVTEAGGQCTDMQGAPGPFKAPTLVADNGFIHDELVARFAEIFQGKIRVQPPKIGG
jgi:myo-inositol-1(or 4)-monophosphatase